MPRPVEALPWGSRSSSRTLWSAARTVARLMAVVVLPTPPFWFARAMTRGRAPPCFGLESGMGAGRTDLAETEDGGGGVGSAREPLGAHDPGAGGIRQFLLGGTALGKQGGAAGGEDAAGVRQEGGERGEGAGGQDAGGGQGGGLDAGWVDFDLGQGQDPGGFDEEGRLAAVRFDQMRLAAGGEGQHQTGE